MHVPRASASPLKPNPGFKAHEVFFRDPAHGFIRLRGVEHVTMKLFEGDRPTAA